jgi:hypothetical protein
MRRLHKTSSWLSYGGLKGSPVGRQSFCRSPPDFYFVLSLDKPPICGLSIKTEQVFVPMIKPQAQPGVFVLY